MIPVAAEIVERFWRLVAKDGPAPAHAPELGECWLWTGNRNRAGYGRLSIGGRRSNERPLAHRLSWAIHHGEAPDGHCVLHKCDNPPCVNPEHLRLGTQAENMRDMLAKGRGGQPGGEEHWSAKLNAQDVDCIRKLYATGIFKQEELAKAFSVHASSVSAVVRGKAWAHL